MKRFYDPRDLLAALEMGENYSIVARKESGDIVGHMALLRSSPYPGLYECGAGLVLPEYRKAGVSLMMFDHLYERLAPQLGVEAVWGEAVCNHVYVQKAVMRHKHVETGLEVDLMPEETYAKEKISSGRVASLLVFRTYVSRPHTVYIPPVYENVFRFLYSELDDRRTFDISRAQAPAGVPSHGSALVFEFAGVARINVSAIGEDFESYLNTLENETIPAGIKVIQVYLNLACPWVAHAVEVLRSRGYFIGGILPRWFDDDGMLMQKIVGTPGWEGIRLFSDRAEEMLRVLRHDWEEVGSNLKTGGSLN